MGTHIEIASNERLDLDPQKPIVVGVSGGPDSLCLGRLLASRGYRCTWAYFDHQLRPSSGEDGRAVQQMAEAAGAAFVRGQGDVQSYAQDARLSVEEAGRSLRYQFLFEQAQLLNAQAVAVAHNADDQVETALMHLLRGAGLDGLSGMAYSSLPNPWSDQIPLVRPLLAVWRADIEAYLQENGLTPLQDPTNQDTRFFRNRLRHELIPFLETFNPNIQSAVWKTANLLQEDREILDEVAGIAWDTCVTWDEDGFVAFEQEALLDHPPGLQRRLIRRAIQILQPGLRDIDYAAVKRAREFVENPPASRSSDLIAGLRLVWEDGQVWLGPWDRELPNLGFPQLESSLPLDFPVPGQVDLGGGWSIEARLIEGPRGKLFGRARGNKDDRYAWFDAAELPQPLLVRTRKPGDRFHPLGMGGHSLKLADFFTNLKLPPRFRDRWPLVTAGDAIVWVTGFRQSDTFQVRSHTTRALRLRLMD